MTLSPITVEYDPPLPTLTASGETLDPAYVGRLRPSQLSDGIDVLRARMNFDGHLYLPGLLNRDEVLETRAEIVRRLGDLGFLDSTQPAMDAVLNPAKVMNNYMPEPLAKANAPLSKMLYSGLMMQFFNSFFGEPARHFDFTWVRSVGPGHGTLCHCDIVYMGRGERERLITAWVPIGDVDFKTGGLMVLEGSNRNIRLKQTYGEQDVDSYCENKPDSRAWGKRWGTGGFLKGSPNQIRRSIVGNQGRWLTSEYRAGDVLIFSVFMVHASLDNHSNRIRLSSDSRYQPASQPADERWVGENPIGHGDGSVKGRIC